MTIAWDSRAELLDVGGIKLSTVIDGRGPLIVLCHGFPELGYSWRHQVSVLVDAGFRVAVPDMRGYGLSSKPDRVEAYDIDMLADDVVGIIDALGEAQAILVGHDWGASVVWHTALAHPDRISAVAGLSVPFVPRAPVPPLDVIRRRLGDDYYLSWFQHVGPADDALAADVARTLTTTRELSPQWATDTEEIVRPPWLTEEDLAYYVHAFTRGGFTPGLSYYRNIDRNWRLSERLEGKHVKQPAMFLTGSEDIVRSVMSPAAMSDWVDDLRLDVVVEGAGHWVQQEAADEVNRALLEFVRSL